ncbi:putative S-adenosyl-L-methionine-dependent methyltransferase, partial [Cynara cardunculus var. scolymus]
MEKCVTPTNSKAEDVEYKLFPESLNAKAEDPFPESLNAIPPRIASGSIPGVSADMYMKDNRQWKKRVNAYKRIHRIIASGRYPNIMDMNAGFGGFAAALDSPKLWTSSTTFPVPHLVSHTTAMAILILEILEPSRSESVGSSIESPAKIDVTSPRVPCTSCRTSTWLKVKKTEAESMLATTSKTTGCGVRRQLAGE